METTSITLPRPVNGWLAFHTEGHKEEENENRNTSILELAWTNNRNEAESDTGNGYGRKNDRRKWTGLIFHESLLLF